MTYEDLKAINENNKHTGNTEGYRIAVAAGDMCKIDRQVIGNTRARVSVDINVRVSELIDNIVSGHAYVENLSAIRRCRGVDIILNRYR